MQPATKRSAEERFNMLVQSFPISADVQPWDAMVLAKRYKGASSGEALAISFLLHLWNGHDPKEEYSVPAFDVIQAVQTWDRRYYNAFQAWTFDPFFP